MANEKRLIDANALLELVQFRLPIDNKNAEVIAGCVDITRRIIENAPTVDAVEVEKYSDLREAFIDYVCSGTSNPAPYCKNRCVECVDRRGWCISQSNKCRGFNPDGEGR